MEALLDTCGQGRVKSLLFIYLFIVKAAGDCPKPFGSDNIVLTNGALLMNNFPEGTQVTLECANGYVIESGSGIITCTDDKWSEPDLTCKKKDCGPPKPQPHMSFNTSSGTLFGAIIGVICEKGYQISGSAFRQCYSTGWSGKAKCEIVTCEIPPEMINGKNTWDTEDDPKYGEMIHYSCNEGYTLIGTDTIMCSESGEYDAEPPECKGVTTEDRVTPSPTSPAQEASTSADSSAAPTAYRDKYITSTAVPTASPSEQDGSKDIVTDEDKAATTRITSTPPSLFQGMHNGTVNNNKDIDYIPVILSVIGVSLVACILALFLHKYLLRRKGSANGTVPIY